MIKVTYGNKCLASMKHNCIKRANMTINVSCMREIISAAEVLLLYSTNDDLKCSHDPSRTTVHDVAGYVTPTVNVKRYCKGKHFC